jgi:hypothetical protein
VIQDLDETIAALLRRDLPATLGEQVQISFATPDDQFPSQSITLPAIDLFLYDVRENLELRSNEVSRTRPSVRVDLSYLITAWPSESVPDPAEDEHRLLGEVMRVLLRYRTLPEEVLQGELRGQRPVLPISTLQPGRLQSMGEFWQAVGGKPKAALNYQVTLSVDVAVPEEVRLVTEKVIRIRMENGEAS